MSDALELLRDLAAEEDDLDAVVAGLDEAGWQRPTPAAGWAVRDQLVHLAWVEEAARVAATDAAAFDTTYLTPARTDPGFEASQMQRGDGLSGREVLAWWRRERSAAMEALTAVAERDPAARLPWFGPPMSIRSFVTARLMETWAHGQDVIDALDVTREPTDRLRHVAHLGVATRGWSYAVRGQAPDDEPVLVELTSPSGDTWRWGPADATSTVKGSALDFCLVVTQRRHWRDTGLAVEGPAAIEWMGIAQAFAGRASDTDEGRKRA